MKELQLAGVAAWRKGFEASDVWPVMSFALEGASTVKVEQEQSLSESKESKKESKKETKKHKKDSKQEKKHKKDKKKKSKDKDGIEVTKVSKDGKEIVLKFKKPHTVWKEKKSLPKD